MESPKTLTESELLGWAAIKLDALLDFCEDENFREFGFGRGGKNHQWIVELEAIASTYENEETPAIISDLRTLGFHLVSRENPSVCADLLNTVEMQIDKRKLD